MQSSSFIHWLQKGCVLLCLLPWFTGNIAHAQSAPSKSPAHAITQAVTPPLNGHAGHGWTRTLNEPFNDNKLSPCWKNSYIHNVHTLANNRELEWYVVPNGKNFNPFRVSHGILSIEAVRAVSEPHTNAHGQPYLSGMIMSDGCFAQRYGYFEIRVKVPEGKGLWPAFWLLASNHKWPPEADVFEMFGGPNSRHEGGLGWVHTGTVKGGTPAYNRWHKVPIDQYKTFNTYGLLWGPQTMSIYVDGQLIASQPTPAGMHTPMYLIANLAVGGEWVESPDATTHFPAIMQIDSIRAWQYKPWRHAKSPAIQKVDSIQ